MLIHVVNVHLTYDKLVGLGYIQAVLSKGNRVIPL